MSTSEKSVNWKIYSGVSVAILATITLTAVYTRLWVLTSIPIGFLFGFFLKKGELCGSSAFSEVILMKDYGKVFGLWVAIVVSMLGFAVINGLGWVQLNPKPMIWLNYIVGGLLFGTGMVLAGGCVSGCLFKAGAGNINSMAGVVGIPLGVAMVQYGPLHQFHIYMKRFVLKADTGSSVTLSSLTGIPFWGLACSFGLLTILGMMFWRKRNGNRLKAGTPKRGAKTVLTQSWKPWKAGLAIGLLGILAYMSSAASGRNYPLGTTEGVIGVQLLMTEKNEEVVWRNSTPKAVSVSQFSERGVARSIETKMKEGSVPKNKKVILWMVGLICSLVAGSWMAEKFSGKLRVLPKPPGQTMVAFLGGILVGAGAAFATGCVIGNIVSGWALMSVGTLLFGVVTVIANWVTTYFYLMGGTISELFES